MYSELEFVFLYISLIISKIKKTFYKYRKLFAHQQINELQFQLELLMFTTKCVQVVCVLLFFLVRILSVHYNLGVRQVTISAVIVHFFFWLRTKLHVVNI